MNAKELTLYPRTQCVINDLSAFVHAHDKVEYYLRHHAKEKSDARLYGLLKTTTDPIVVPVENLNKNGYSSWGKFNEERPNEIMVRANLLRGLEVAKLEETIYGTAFLVLATLLHETVHYCRFKNQEDTKTYEYGDGFERDAFGSYINENNSNHYGAIYKRSFVRLTNALSKDKSVIRDRARHIP